MSGTENLPVGKLPRKIMEELFRKLGSVGDEVVVGPGTGSDAAVIDFGDRYLIAKTDPITFLSEDMGWYLVNVNANDIACMGGEPKWLLVCLLFPDRGITEDDVQDIMNSIVEASRNLGIQVIGGHTEVTDGLERPIAIGQMLGIASKEKLIRPGGALPGDVIVLTKGLAIEATSIVARTKYQELIEKGWNSAQIDQCADFIRHPGISIVQDARTACQSVEVHALHDPTEGGVATGVYELCIASEVGAEIIEERLFYSDFTKKILGEFGLDPLGAISSGALLIVASESDAGKLIQALDKSAIRADMIGTIHDKSYGIKICREDTYEDLPDFQTDEVTKLF